MIKFIPIDGQPPNWYLTVGELVARVEAIGTGRDAEAAGRRATRLLAERFEQFGGDLIAGFTVRDELNPHFPQRGDPAQCTMSGTIVRLNRDADGTLVPLAAEAIPKNILDI